MNQLLLLALSCSGACFLFAVQTELIIFNYAKQPLASETKHKVTACTLYWQDPVQPETVQIIQSDDPQETIFRIINSWLAFLHNEDVFKKIHAETVLCAPSGAELFISFNRNPFGKQQSIAEKCAFIEYLFKTIKPYTGARRARLLVQHVPIQDHHLDFTESWNIL